MNIYEKEKKQIKVKAKTELFIGFFSIILTLVIYFNIQILPLDFLIPINLIVAIIALITLLQGIGGIIDSK